VTGGGEPLSKGKEGRKGKRRKKGIEGATKKRNHNFHSKRREKKTAPMKRKLFIPRRSVMTERGNRGLF